MLVRRAVIDQVGALTERWFMYAEDQEWCARMKFDGWKIYHVPEAVVEHRHSASFKQNPQVSVLPLTALRGLFIQLNRPSRAQLLLHDWAMAMGLTLRGVGDFLRGLSGPADVRELRRGRSKKFFDDARLVMRGLRSAKD
jgi:GT2 family glycosyltransferase